MQPDTVLGNQQFGLAIGKSLQMLQRGVLNSKNKRS
jgi:hypothetical protein